MIGIPDFWSTRWLERPIFSRADPFFYCSFSFGLEKKTHADLKSRRSEKYATREVPSSLSSDTPCPFSAFVDRFFCFEQLNPCPRMKRPIFSRADPFFYCSFSFGLEKKTHADLKSRRSKKYAPREAPSRSTPFVVLSFVRYFLSIRHLRGQILLY
jgi:hypothetical protein